MKLLNNRSITILFLFWRLFLFLPLFFSEKFIAFRKGFEYTSTNSFTQLSNPITHFLLSPWGNFDGVYYHTIAGDAYTVDNSGFFPLFPMVIKIFSFNSKAFSPLQFFVALILVSLVFFISLVVFYKLIKLDYNDRVALETIIFAILFPASFFFVSIYSESLFFLLLLLSFYFARKKKWLVASIFGIFLTATRLVGIAILPALIYEFWREEKKLLKTKFIPILLIPFGLISYSLFNFWQWKNPLHFIAVQGTFHNGRIVNGVILFPQTIFRYLKILTTASINYEWWIALFELSTFVFVTVLLFVAWKKKIRASYLIFSVIAFLIPTLTGTFTGLPRYVLPLFPIFIALSLIQNRFIKIVYCLVGIILLFVLFALFSKGYFVS